ncbi:MAG: phosphoribosylformylglycinamidine synthase subunit PurL [Methanomassiliicoccales archaeon]
MAVRLLDKDSDGLMQINETLRLSLDVGEMEKIRDYFVREGREPTDLEIHSLAQAWSEHCSYKSSKLLIKKYLAPLGKRAFRIGDAGVMEFDDTHVYSLKMESHNHPSAIEPYGGAGTGIGGIVRDILCMGTRPVALADPLFFGPPDIVNNEVPSGVRHPAFLFQGVIAGIRDYGNRIGVPTVSGGVWFSRKFIGNCLVNAACLGFGRKEDIVPNYFLSEGDAIILAGGLTGRDGIHGVNFASRVLSERSEEERGAVQLGDPITKEPLIEAIMELDRMKLIRGMKDLGGGGLSAAAGEMAHSGGFGAEIQLDDVLLREKGMLPWEIWISESQERMLLSVRERDVDAVLSVFDFWDVKAARIGKVTSGRMRVYWRQQLAGDLDIGFTYGGPAYQRNSSPKPRREHGPLPDLGTLDLREMALKVISHPSCCSRDYIVHMYDHDVGGRTCLKPLGGIPPVLSHNDAAVLRPRNDSWKGLAVTVAACPSVAAFDPYQGALRAVDEICRNIVAVGGIPDAVTNCLNFGNPEKGEIMWQFEETMRGLSEACRALSIAVPSGNVSFYNDGPAGPIPPTVALLGTGIVGDVRRCVSSGIKREGSALYLIGKQSRSFNGSVLSDILGFSDGRVESVDLNHLASLCSNLRKTMDRGLILSCHDVSDGGVFACISEMCFGSMTGAEINIDNLSGSTFTEALFAEGPSQWIVEIPEKDASLLEESFGADATRIGTTGGSSVVLSSSKMRGLEMDLAELRDAWHSTLWRLMG